MNGPGDSSQKEQTTEDGKIQDANKLNNDSQEDYSPIFRVSSTRTIQLEQGRTV